MDGGATEAPRTRYEEHGEFTEGVLSETERNNDRRERDHSSFDVVSLFTAIPRDLAESTFWELLGELPEGSPTVDHFLQLLRSCLHTVFTFDGEMNEKLKGTTMGAPISGVITQAVLQRLEKAALEEYRPKMCLRYVCDTFVIIEREKTDDFFRILNSVFPAFQFTF